jgi:DNA-directed RNA polymerase sigma subunit (sigma70/sigma32)
MYYNENETHGNTLVCLRDSYPTPLRGAQRHDFYASAMSEEDFAKYIYARNRLAELNRGLVFEIAASVHTKWGCATIGLDISDLAGAGFEMMLLKAVDWSPDKGAFSTFMTFWLTKSMTEARLVHKYGKRHTAEAVIEASRLAREYPAVPVGERAELSSIKLFRENPASLPHWTTSAHALENIKSLDELTENSLYDHPTQAPSTVDTYGGDLLSSLREALTQEEAHVVCAAFGLLTGEPKAVKLIPRSLVKAGFTSFRGWGEARTQQVLDSALARLRLLGTDALTPLVGAA